MTSPPRPPVRGVPGRAAPPRDPRPAGAVVVWDGTPRLHGGLLTCDPEVPVARPVGSDDVVPVKRPRGRPPRTGARAAARIEVRMSLEELRALKTLAASSGASVADLIRMAVADLAADDGQRGPVVSGRDVLTSVR